MKIMVFGWFGYKNLGDDLLLEIVLKQIASTNNISQTTIAAQDASYFSFPEARNCKFVGRGIVDLLKGSKENDLLIVGPGGLFPHKSSVKIAAFFVITTFWRIRGKRVAYYLIGANGDISSVGIFLWKKIVSQSVLFVTRDADLFDAALLKQESSKCFPAADAVFSVDRGMFSGDDSPSGRRVAVSFANLFNGTEPKFKHFVDNCVTVVRGLIGQGYLVDLLTFTEGADTVLNEAIAGEVKDGVDVLSYADTFKAVSTLRRYEMVVGMRFHSVALAVLARVPVIPISYSQKTERLIRDCLMVENLTYFCKSEHEYYGREIPLDANRVLSIVDSCKKDPEMFLVNEECVLMLQKKSCEAKDSLLKLVAVDA